MTRDPNTPRQKRKTKPSRRRVIMMRFAVLIVLLMATSLVFNGYARRANQGLKTPAEVHHEPRKADAKSVDSTEF